ncbi:MAG: intermembrane phospholipid transport protein YdbH family protein [Geminicoccaceae bacterium]
MRLVLIALAAVLGLAAALVAALPWLAEPALRLGLRLAALDDVDFDRLRFGWGDLELEGIALGQADQEVGRLRVVYHLPDLLGGRLERVEIEDLVVRAAWRDGRLHLAGIDATDASGPSLPIPDVDQAVLRDARLELTTGLGTLLVPFSAQLRTIGGRRAFEATIDDARLAGSGAISATGSFEGDLPRGAPLALDQARLRGNLAVLAEQATIDGVQDLAGEVTVTFALAEGRLQVETRVSDAAWQGTTLGEARIELTAEGSAQAARGTLGLALSDAGFAAADLVVSGASLDQRLDWSYAADTLMLHASEPGALAIENLTVPDVRAGPLRARLEPADRPLLELTLDEGRPAAWRQHLSAGIEALEAHLTASALRLQSEAGTITLMAEGVGPSLAHAGIGLAEGRLRLPDHALALDGIAAEAGLIATGLAPDQTVPIGVERISHAGRPAWFAPMALQARLAPGAENLGFEATLTRIGGGLALEVRGNSQAAGAGRAAVELAPVTFGPGLQPKDLAPIAAGLVSDVSGEVALNGDVAWSTAGITSDLAILVDQVGLSSGPARLEQVNGVVRLDGLWPPTTPPGQQLAIGLLDLGLPLTAGTATFQLTDGPRLEVEQLEWRLAGGIARAEPFSLGSPLEGLNVTLRAEQLDLGQLLALTRMEGLSGEGSLDGVLPVRLSQGAAVVDGGELAATGPGVLRYASGSAPAALQAGGQGVDLLLQALENFHYEALKITLDGRTDAAMDIDLHLAGANPDLYDGHPVEFNLDLEGELANILRQGVASWQIPERIRERMQGFER